MSDTLNILCFVIALSALVTAIYCLLSHSSNYTNTTPGNMSSPSTDTRVLTIDTINNLAYDDLETLISQSESVKELVTKTVDTAVAAATKNLVSYDSNLRIYNANIDPNSDAYGWLSSPGPSQNDIATWQRWATGSVLTLQKI